MVRPMARTPSTMIPLGTPCPDFHLTDTRGGTAVTPSAFARKPLLVVFLCNHCPFVVHLADGLAAFSRAYAAKGLAMVGINSNDAAAYPDDAPEHMPAEAERRGYAFPYCFDADQSVAQAFQAACTPDFFLFDRDHRLAYRGQFDDSRPKGISAAPVTGADLRAAADAVLAGRPVPTTQKPSLGCNIKWKPGNEPADVRL